VLNVNGERYKEERKTKKENKEAEEQKWKQWNVPNDVWDRVERVCKCLIGAVCRHMSQIGCSDVNSNKTRCHSELPR
jgi:hypothetical protein